jgi:hypothetical protein
MYPPPVAFGIVVIPLLAAIFIAALGVVASTHAATVRQAYQRIAIPMFIIVMLPSLGISMLPGDALASLYSLEFAESALATAVIVTALVLIVLDGLVLTLALRGFQRARLITN